MAQQEAEQIGVCYVMGTICPAIDKWTSQVEGILCDSKGSGKEEKHVLLSISNPLHAYHIIPEAALTAQPLYDHGRVLNITSSIAVSSTSTTK
jgi:hypothetical protein